MSSEPSLEDLQDSLMTELEALNMERLGLIKIKHATWLAIAGQPPPAPLVYQDGNLLQTMNNLKYCSNARVYLESPQYAEGGVPIPSKKRLETLATALKTAAIAGGDVIVSSGKGQKVKNESYNRVLCLRCQCSITYRGVKMSADGKSVSDMSYRKISYVND